MGQRCCKALVFEEFEVDGDEILDSSDICERPQYVYCMRHGEREDSVNKEWIKLTDRPYDPPLTAQGRMDAKATAQEILKREREEWPSTIVTSPFLRCIQTAAVVYNELSVNGIYCGNIIVDYELSEIHHPQVLHTIDNIAPTFSEDSIRSAIQIAVDGQNFETPHEGTIKPRVVFLGIPINFPERREEAHVRYINYFCSTVPTTSNCVLVTHGEAVSCSISSINDNLQVFNTDYCSYSVRMRANGHTPWTLLSKTGENGIEWLDKAELDIN